MDDLHLNGSRSQKVRGWQGKTGPHVGNMTDHKTNVKHRGRRVSTLHIWPVKIRASESNIVRVRDCYPRVWDCYPRVCKPVQCQWAFYSNMKCALCSYLATYATIAGARDRTTACKATQLTDDLTRGLLNMTCETCQ